MDEVVGEVSCLAIMGFYGTLELVISKHNHQFL